MTMVLRWALTGVVLALATSSVNAFSYHAPQGKGSRAYIAQSYRNVQGLGVRPTTTRLYLSPANMMAKLSSDLVSSVENILESPDFNRLWLQMDDRTILSVIIYSFVFLVGMFVATTTNDLNAIDEPPAAPPVDKRRAYTQVPTNTKTQWNMENERVQKVNHMWKKRESLQTATRNESITYHRNVPKTSPPATYPAQPYQPPSYAQASPPAVVPADTVHGSYPPPVNTIAQQVSYPSPVNTATQHASYPAPVNTVTQTSSYHDQHSTNHQEAYYPPAPAPPISNTQYMAGLGSSSSVKQSYAVAGPNYTVRDTSPKRSYKMTKWTPDQAVAPTNLYLANMSGPNRPALGSAVDIPLYFSPGVIPDAAEETYYEDEDEYNYEDQYNDIPQGKGAARSYAMTHWKPDMRVNQAGPGANAYLSNMNQPSYRYEQKKESYATSNGLMTGFPSMISTELPRPQNGISFAEVNGSNNGLHNEFASSKANDTFGGVSSNVVNGHSPSNMGAKLNANGSTLGSSLPSEVESSHIQPPAPAPYQPYFVASTTLGSNNDPTKKSYSMTNWKPGLANPSGSALGNSYLATMNSQQREPSSYAQSSGNENSPAVDKMASWAHGNDEGMSTFTTVMSTTQAASPSLTPQLFQDPPTIESGANKVETAKKSYSMTSWKPGSTKQAGSGWGETYLSSMNSRQSASFPSVTPESHSPPASVQYQPSLNSAAAANQDGRATVGSRTYDSGSVWTPDSVGAADTAFGSTEPTGINSDDNNAAASEPWKSEVVESPAPVPYQPSFVGVPGEGASNWQRGTPDSIIGNPYFAGMGSSYGNTEAPGSRDQPAEDDWRQAGPPIWGVVDSETPIEKRQMQMQA